MIKIISKIVFVEIVIIKGKKCTKRQKSLNLIIVSSCWRGCFSGDLWAKKNLVLLRYCIVATRMIIRYCTALFLMNKRNRVVMKIF